MSTLQISAFLVISNTGYRKANCYITVSEIESFAQALEVFGCFLRDLWMWTANANVVVILFAFLRQFVDSDKLVTMSYHEGHSASQALAYAHQDYVGVIY